MLADPADRRLERDDALLALVVDPLPLAEVLPGGRHAADRLGPFERMMNPFGQKSCGIVSR